MPVTCTDRTRSRAVATSPGAREDGDMKLQNADEVLRRLEGDPAAARVYGEPHETADGTTVIPVAKPVGVFVIKDGRATWKPAVDTTRIAMLGILVGLASAVFAGVAMVRRPPWPDLYGDIAQLRSS
ncbi:hypothetical protein MPUL_46970 [Mycolicibacterium pulveris]|uniref:Uncharacterized protein n=2 Tax=Mycolicibacterium pulveris TaxID=36813 RepID=A0A7I7USF6_MYCPV|nr:hypothetical protein MPUL_46970 [Mycolicibacterium pulveris]